MSISLILFSSLVDVMLVPLALLLSKFLSSLLYSKQQQKMQKIAKLGLSGRPVLVEKGMVEVVRSI